MIPDTEVTLAPAPVLTPGLDHLLSRLEQIVEAALARDRAAFLAAEEAHRSAEAKANADFELALAALRAERRERGAQVRAARAAVLAVEQGRRRKLSELEAQLAARREAIAAAAQRRAADSAAALAQARQRLAIIVDKVDAARALVGMYGDLAGELAGVDEALLAGARKAVDDAELAHATAQADRAAAEALEVEAAEAAFRAAVDQVMKQSMAECGSARAAEQAVVDGILSLASGDLHVLRRLREDRDAAIAAARAAFEEACLWHADGRAAVEGERAGRRAAEAMARARAEAERQAAEEAARAARAEAGREAQRQAAPYVQEIRGLYSSQRIRAAVLAARKRLSKEALALVRSAAAARQQYAADVRQLLATYPHRPAKGIELITPENAAIFDAAGRLVEVWELGRHFALADVDTRKQYAGWKPGRIFQAARQPGCVAYRFPASSGRRAGA